MRRESGSCEWRVSKAGRGIVALAGVLIGLWLLARNIALGQVSPCTSAAGQQPSTTITTGAPPLYYSATDLSAGGGSNTFNVNTDGHGNPTGNASVTFESPGRICLGPGFQAAATSGVGFHAVIGTILEPVTISSNYSGRQVTVDGVNYTAPQTFQWAVGSPHLLGVPPSQTGYVFSNWTGGGSGQAEPIVVPMSAASYTASFLLAQTISFGTLSNVTYGTGTVPIGAIASSGLTVTFTSTTPSVCTVIAGPQVFLSSGGICSITATQAGNPTYAAAPPVIQPFLVNAASQNISFTGPSNVSYGAAPFTLGATATSNLSVTLTSTTTGVCTVSGATVTILGVGTCSITGSVAGNANYLPVSSVFPITVSQASQTITFGTLRNVTFGAAQFTTGATASSLLPVSLTSTTTSVCTVSAATVTIIATGTCSITASQAGNANYAPAPNVPQSFTVVPAWPGQLSVFPAYPTAGNFAIQTFTFTFSDPTPGANFTSAGVQFRNAAGGTCTWTYSPASNALSYAEPSFSGGPYYPGTTTGSFGGSLCSTNFDLSTASVSSGNVTLILTITFPNLFNGSVYMQALTSIPLRLCSRALRMEIHPCGFLRNLVRSEVVPSRK